MPDESQLDPVHEVALAADRGKGVGFNNRDRIPRLSEIDDGALYLFCSLYRSNFGTISDPALLHKCVL